MKNCFITILLVLARTLSGYTDGTLLTGDSGAVTVTVTNTGSQGGTQTVTMPVTGTNHFKVWFSIAGYPEQGSSSVCPAPCGVSINTEYGQVSYWYQIFNSGGSPVSAVSSQSFLSFTPQPAISSSIPSPMDIHGFRGSFSTISFSIPSGTDVSALRVWEWLYNARNRTASVVSNSGILHTISTTPVTGFTSDGSTCTGTTGEVNGLVPGVLVQLNYFNTLTSGINGIDKVNGSYTIATTPTTKTFTVACSLAAGDWHGPVPGADNGQTVSSQVFYADEQRWYAPLTGIHSPFQIMIPVSPSEFTAGISNNLKVMFNGTGDASLDDVNHGYYARVNVVQRDFEITQITVAGSDAVATTSSPHGYSSGDTVLIRDAPGPQWRFNGMRVLTAITSTTFTFQWGPSAVNLGGAGDTAGSGAFITTAGSYTVPVSKQSSIHQQPHMYAARCLIPFSAFTPFDPASGTFGGNASNGNTVWTSSALKNPNSYYPSHASHNSHCQNCHTHSGIDMKYFGINQHVSVIAGIHRGLSESDARDVAAFIAANATSTPALGRPWNGAYQPEPGIDSAPVQNWSAGGGWQWTLTYDQDMREWAVPSGSYAKWKAQANPYYSTHEVPVYVPMPTWLQWLPRTDPSDFYFYQLGGLDFTASPLYTTYQTRLADFSPCSLSSGITSGTTSFAVSGCGLVANNDYLQIQSTGEYVHVSSGAGTGTIIVTRGQKGTVAASASSGEFVSDFTAFFANNGVDLYPQIFTYQGAYGARQGQEASAAWPAQYGNSAYDVLLWGETHGWEIRHEFWMEQMEDQVYVSFDGSPNARAAPQYTRGLYSRGEHFLNGPHVGFVPSTHTFENTTQTGPGNWTRFTEMWYHLACILDCGDRFLMSQEQIDSGYQIIFYTDSIRPSFYMHWNQNMWMNANAIGATPTNSLHSVEYTLTLGLNMGGIDTFTPATEEQEVIQALAETLAADINGSIYSAAQWQAWAVNFGMNQCPLSRVPSASFGYGGIGCVQDSVAYALAVFNTEGASSGDLSAIVSWANSVWASSGHNFTADAAATCSYTASGSGPNTFTGCSNF